MKKKEEKTETIPPAPPFKSKVLKIGGALYVRIPAAWRKENHIELEAGDEVEMALVDLRKRW